MAEQQLKYYLYLLNNKGIECKGELLIPKENRKEMIVLNENDKIMIENRLKDINELCNKVLHQKLLNSKICKKCAYYELCYI